MSDEIYDQAGLLSYFPLPKEWLMNDDLPFPAMGMMVPGSTIMPPPPIEYFMPRYMRDRHPVTFEPLDTE